MTDCRCLSITTQACDLYINKGNKIMSKIIFRIINTPSLLARRIVFSLYFKQKVD